MKLVRYGATGQERAGVIGRDGCLRDLSMLLPDLTPQQLAPRTLQALALLDIDRLPRVEGAPRLGCPVAGIGKIVCVGLNYAGHARETGATPPKEPVLFMKATSALSGPSDDIVIPPGALKTDWEVELGVVIGTRARHVSAADALQHVAGYVLVNDVSERAFQMERGGQWDKGKGCDTFGPIGPWLVTADEVGDVQQLGMWLDVNGQRMQTGNTATMIFNVAQIVSYLSRFMTLNPGDVITTGTPPGVGMGQKPNPVFLKAGDVMRLGIDKLGEQQQTVYAWDPERIDA